MHKAFIKKVFAGVLFIIILILIIKIAERKTQCFGGGGSKKKHDRCESPIFKNWNFGKTRRPKPQFWFKKKYFAPWKTSEVMNGIGVLIFKVICADHYIPLCGGCFQRGIIHRKWGNNWCTLQMRSAVRYFEMGSLRKYRQISQTNFKPHHVLISNFPPKCPRNHFVLDRNLRGALGRWCGIRAVVLCGWSARRRHTATGTYRTQKQRHAGGRSKKSKRRPLAWYGRRHSYRSPGTPLSMGPHTGALRRNWKYISVFS